MCRYFPSKYRREIRRLNGELETVLDRVLELAAKRGRVDVERAVIVGRGRWVRICASAWPRVQTHRHARSRRCVCRAIHPR